jgi:hypothetical protein
LTNSDVQALGVLDNTVSTLQRGYEFHEKVELIRELWMNPKNIVEGGRLNSECLKLATFEILFTADDKRNDESRIKQHTPLIRSCNIPEELWKLAQVALREKLINMGVLRSINWKNDPRRTMVALEKLVQDKKIPEFKSRMETIKAIARIIPGIIRAKVSAFPNLATPQETFLKEFSEICSIESLAREFRSELTRLKGGAVFSHENLTKK